MPLQCLRPLCSADLTHEDLAKKHACNTNKKQALFSTKVVYSESEIGGNLESESTS